MALRSKSRIEAPAFGRATAQRNRDPEEPVPPLPPDSTHGRMRNKFDNCPQCRPALPSVRHSPSTVRRCRLQYLRAKCADSCRRPGTGAAADCSAFVRSTSPCHPFLSTTQGVGPFRHVVTNSASMMLDSHACAPYLKIIITLGTTCEIRNPLLIRACLKPESHKKDLDRTDLARRENSFRGSLFRR
jgi:hypothetical protein